MLLFDLDGTLLRSDKTISQRTLNALEECRKRGIIIGISTSRGEQNAAAFMGVLRPQVLISSGGALIKYNDKYIYSAAFSPEETRYIIKTICRICGNECEITADTADCHYWNYKTDPRSQDKSWSESIYTDFSDFDKPALKICAEIPENSKAEQLRETLSICDCIRFSDGFWYKLTRKGVTKEAAVIKVCAEAGIVAEDITAFGDDLADTGMLKLCGTGVAMGNSVGEVKEKADIVIGSNDEDGIAEYLENILFNL